VGEEKAVKDRPARADFADAVQQTFLKPAHISRTNAESLFIEADALEFVPLPDDPEGKSIVVAERHFKATHLVGIGFFVPPDSVQVHMLIRIPPALRSDVIAPIQTLARILESNFGARITVGSRTGKLILNERIELTSGGQLVQVSAQDSHDIHNGSYVCMRQDGDRHFAECALCFALDMTVYRKSISH
jgi:hypothetical protein